MADGADTDLVSFVGFEWTQVGQTPDGHYGHKNVIFRDLEDTKIAKRPIASGGVTVRALRTQGKDLVPLALPVLDFSNRKEYFDIRRFLQNAADTALCDPETPVADLLHPVLKWLKHRLSFCQSGCTRRGSACYSSWHDMGFLYTNRHNI